ncbi:MAG: penicillin-binding transpeptidase domain-containing protein [candidate division WOR-3 bacterium]|nr:penicillin-binding transpeptidase domain-containing protein [candidate division WOR-3 bacterium]
MFLLSFLLLKSKSIYWSIDQKLQKLADSILLENSKYYKYSVILVAEVKTGRIIAISCYKGDKLDYNICFNEKFPSASLFKITTAIASIEILGLNSDDPIFYVGKIYSNKPYVWLSNGNTKVQTLKLAFGLSNNPAFGKLATLIGSWRLYEYSRRLFFESYYPIDDFSLALMGAGFINSYITPMNALKLSLSLSNKGLIKSITLIDSIPNIYYYNVKIEGRVMEEKTFYELKELFKETVKNGTASKYLRNYDVGGKTGSLSDKIHGGYIEWFIGFLPVDEPKYAFVSMSVEKKYNNKLSPILNIKPIIEFLSKKNNFICCFP